MALHGTGGGLVDGADLAPRLRDANARRRAELMPPPLLLESWQLKGGVQGLGWHDLALCRDPDGDEAHDFWEAISGGCFRRCVFGSS